MMKSRFRRRDESQAIILRCWANLQQTEAGFNKCSDEVGTRLSELKDSKSCRTARNDRILFHCKRERERTSPPSINTSSQDKINNTFPQRLLLSALIISISMSILNT